MKRGLAKQEFADHSGLDAEADSQPEMELDEEDSHDLQLNGLNLTAIKQNVERMKIDLILVHHEKNNKTYTELIPQFDLQEFIANNNFDIRINALLARLKSMGFPLENNLVYYYSADAEMYVYCGLDPVPDDVLIPKEDFFEQRQLRIKCRENPIGLIHQIMSEDANENIAKAKEGQQVQMKQENNANSKCRRTKERKIGYIIQKVVQWRQYYNGKQDQTGKRYSLEEAAKKVNISKKSLDDYLLQIRFGRRFGFNFNEHQNDKVGVLRAFVKKHKSANDKNKKGAQEKSAPQKKGGAKNQAANNAGGDDEQSD